ncbi:MAG: efflux RND transporter permease subunit [Burkholderiales bacterium]|nr:efflux RND transporter permease subunit [Burkholderiales bacterium]
MWFTRISIQNPVFATMMMAAFLVLGLFSYNQLKVEQFPDVSFPVVVIASEYPGASPEVVESDVSRPLEEVINTIAGLKNLSSRSYEGNSVIIAEFDLTIDPVQAAQDVREKVALVRPALRKEVKEPRISRFNPDDFPVISVVVKGDRPIRELTLLANQIIKKRIENAPGVGSATVVGGLRREMQVLLKPTEMEALRLGVDQVISALRSENQELPSGNLRAQNTEQVVQLRARLKDVAAFERMVVARRGGQPVTLGQVAQVIDGEQEKETLALVNGVPALSLDVVKSQAANTIEVVDRVRKVVAELQKELPPDIELMLVRDQSISIRNSVADVKKTLLEGAGLTVLIVFLFLSSWRSTVITGLTLPISLIGTFLVMFVMGFSINVLTLLAMSICVGLLIDDAIVVRENIVRHISMGKDHKSAALEGTREIGLAVLATTLSIVAVFLPVGFMGGIIGRFFHQFGLTVAFAVLLSMFVSFTLDPMLSSIWPDPDAHGATGNNPIAKALRQFQRAMESLERTYVRLLGWGLNRPKTVLALALGSFLMSFVLMKYVGSEFVPQPDNGELNVQFYTPVGSSLNLTQRKAEQVEKALREFPEVVFTYTTVNTGIAQGKNYGTTFIKLTNRKTREKNIKELTPLLRERLQQIAGITITQIGQGGAVSSGKPVQISLLGPDNGVLAKYAQDVMDIMARQAYFVDIDTSSKPAKPTLALTVKRELAADQGIGVNRINDAVRPLLAGEIASTWLAPDGENYDVTVRLPAGERDSPNDLSRLYVSSSQLEADGSPKMVALREVVDFNATVGPSQINRKALTREILITANVNGMATGTASNALKAELEALNLPPGYRFNFGGSSKDIAETLSFAAQALALAVIFIYLILASQFGSFTQPIAIMVSLPLALIGVILALLLWRSTLNMFSIIGFIMLMGLVTKNAILLVDFVNQALKGGMELREALLNAAEVRLRPILMTTLAMIFGMLPLAVGMGEGSEQRAPMAHAVIGGVITSTLLTLIVVPVIYALLHRLTHKKNNTAQRQAI